MGGFSEFRVWVLVVVSCGCNCVVMGCVSSAGVFLRFSFCVGVVWYSWSGCCYGLRVLVSYNADSGLWC